jgi:hypothetical protein
MMRYLTHNTTVTPDLIRGLAFLCSGSSSSNAGEGNLTPGQARGDDICERSVSQ